MVSSAYLYEGLMICDNHIAADAERGGQDGAIRRPSNDDLCTVTDRVERLDITVAAVQQSTLWFSP